MRVLPAEDAIIQAALKRGLHRIEQLALQQRQHRLRFRVAEAHVVFQEIDAARVHHQPEENHAGKIHAFGDDALERRLQNVAAEGGHFGIAKARMRRDDAHAAGILAGVALADGLVVARADERHDVAAVAERQQRAFIAFEKFLNDDFIARIAKAARLHHRAHRRFRLGAVLTNHHALARGKSARLDHRRISAVLHIGERGIEFAETGVGGGFHAIFLHKVLGETLAAFQLRRLTVWAENGEPCRLENINNPLD